MQIIIQDINIFLGLRSQHPTANGVNNIIKDDKLFPGSNYTEV